jgi:hypothetical protein
MAYLQVSQWTGNKKAFCVLEFAKTELVVANFKTQNAFLFPVHAMFRHDCPLVVKPASTPRCLVHKNTWRDSIPIDMLLSAVSVLVVAQSSSEIPKVLMNYPVFLVRVLCQCIVCPCCDRTALQVLSAVLLD